MDEIIRPRIIRYRMCYALFSVATSSLTGRGSSIEERGSRLSRYRGSSFRSLPPWCDPCVEDRTVSTSRALFSTRMLKDEKRLKNEVGVHENIRALGPVGRVSRGGNGTPERLFNILQRWRTTFFLFLSYSPAG